MIIDKIKNIKLYRDIPDIVIEFVENLRSNGVTLGKHVLSEKIYANVEEYSTKLLKDAEFETHDEYIDIQLLLSGVEKVAIADRNCLNVSEPYDITRDITFYSDDVNNFPYVELDGTNFIMIYPHEGHAPQISIDDSVEKVLKVVLKIKI